MTSHAVQTRLWTREEYERLVAAGFFNPAERLELIEGELLRMTPQGSAHATAVRLAEEALRSAFAQGFDVRVQMPLALDPDSEPEPDLAVVVGSPRDYRDAHPRTAVLVVEVADATLAYDRERKARMYAAADIPEYWVLNLIDRCLEIHRDPAGAPRSGYNTRIEIGAGQDASLRAHPTVSIPLSDLLP